MRPMSRILCAVLAWFGVVPTGVHLSSVHLGLVTGHLRSLVSGRSP